MHAARPPAIRRRKAAAAVAGLAIIAATPSAITTADAATDARQATSTPAALQAIDGVPGKLVSTDAVRIPGNVRHYQTRKSLLGLHKWYRQYKGGHPVVGGWWGWHRDKQGNVTVWDGRRKVGKVNTEQPEISADLATSSADKVSNALAAHVTRRSLVVLGPAAAGGEARLAWAISSADGTGARTSYVDAVTGEVLQTVLDSKFGQSPKLRDGRGRVFDPNPIQKLQDQSLRDHLDAADAVPPRAYSMRKLAHLKGKGHTLVGRWVQIVNNDRATVKRSSFKYNRKNDYFEQVVAYYAIDVEQSYLQRLGFHDVNAESEKIRVNGFPEDNSYYNPPTDMIATGTGGVDDAEDPEVVWHEYGHAIHADQIPAWGSRYEGRAIGEAFGDYMAVTMSQRYGRDTDVAPTACVMDWDATSYTSGRPHCLRRTDEDKVYPADLDPSRDPHIDGEIWARALWDINQAIGRNHATKIIVEAQFWMTPRIEFKAAARTTVSIARDLYPDRPLIQSAVIQAFADRGFVAPPT